MQPLKYYTTTYIWFRHLGGYCENGNFCNFQHEPKLTTAELNALRYKTRSLACKNRYCENIDCCKFDTISQL